MVERKGEHGYAQSRRLRLTNAAMRLGRTFRRGLIGIQRSIAADKIQTLSCWTSGGFAPRHLLRPTSNIKQTISGIGDMLSRRQSSEQMGGPIMMAEVTGKVAELGLRAAVALDCVHFSQYRLFEPAADPGSWMADTFCSTPMRRCSGSR